MAADLGLPPGVQVVAGVPDLHAAAIGSGALGPGQAHMALSSTSWISLPVPRKKTRVSKAAKRRRVDDKKHHGAIKSLRSKQAHD